MAAVTGAILGGAGLAKGFLDQSKARKAAKNQTEFEAALTAQDRARIDKAQEEAIQANLRLFGPAQQAGLAGSQAALDIFGQSVPEQARLFQAGNVAAQNQLIGGLQPFQQALLGQPINFGAMRATQITPDFSAIRNAQLPQFTSIAEALATPTGTQADPFVVEESEQQAKERVNVLDQPFENSSLTPNEIVGFLQRGAPVRDMAMFGLDQAALERAVALSGRQNNPASFDVAVDVFGNPVRGELPTLSPQQRQRFMNQRATALGGLGGMAGMNPINPAFLA